ncbi:hypothetical protein [Allobaculum sp. Allo2]|uniref:hypothetical protein n=1 Tax=Allobaculum sp. Allo2 TaxID=2853432 RepID=UPI001F60105D|nr:hypothetical protein [Allobaculum sp. Allo2]UNT94012.1 hypothetical protein KWG61_04950 [Allobaculum sp. Allo2]
MKTPVRQNLHTHTQYDDGKDSLMAMTEEAIARGFTVLGFSGHSPTIRSTLDRWTRTVWNTTSKTLRP